MSQGVHGVVVVDKPAGCTSHDVVAKCRKAFGTSKVGHAGTLDPDVTGVLVVTVGHCTRLVRYIGAHPKSYAGEIALGTSTSTLDASGEQTGRVDMSDVTLEDVRSAAAKLTGEIRQVPPMVSAVRVGGRRLHEMARQGLEVAREARPVTIHEFQVIDERQPGVFGVRVVCSPGTYIRTLAADLGLALGGLAHLKKLTRTAVGPFGMDEAVDLARIQADGASVLMPPREAVRGMPAVQLDEGQAGDLSHGRRLSAESVGAQSGAGPWAAFSPAGELVAVCRTEGSRFQPEVVVPS